mmetsp:Transcript_46757/g.39443  ORF Transcript_46757/g.39443 Transcript_46757/m.39443 type:complete len:243 (-) Transcript_46757:116-844(-)
MFHHKAKDHSTTSGLQAMATKISTDIVQKQVMTDAMSQQMNAMTGPSKSRQVNREEKIMTEEEMDHLLDLDDDNFSSNYREDRMQVLKHEALKSSNKVIRGEYIELFESEFIDITTKKELVVVHFYHKDFKNCRLMDIHLREIAKTHGETVFARIDSEKAPFFVVKLQIQTLPTLLMFKNGVVQDRVIGFEEVAENLDFDTILLTRRLCKSKCVVAKNRIEAGQVNIKKDDDEDDDLDDMDF